MNSPSHPTEPSPSSAADGTTSTAEPANVRSFWNIFQLLRGLLTRQEKTAFVLILGGMLVSAVGDAVCIGGLSVYTSVISEPAKLADLPFADRWAGAPVERVALWGGLGLIGLFVFKFVVVVALVWHRTRFAERLRVRLSSEIFRRYMYAPWEFHLHHNTAELMRNVVNETNQMSTQVVMPLLQLAASLLQSIAVLAVLLVTAEFIGLLPLVPVALVVGIFLVTTRKRLVQYGKQVQRERKESIRTVREGLSSLPETVILAKQEFIIDRYARLLKSFASVQSKQKLIAGITTPLMETAVVGALIAVIVSMFILGRTIAEVGPLLVLMAAASLRLKTSLIAVTTATNQLKFSQACLELVSAEIKRPCEQAKFAPVSQAEPTQPWKNLELNSVGFKYEGAEDWALRDVSLKINPGDRIGIVGGSGSGKSTLVSLLLGILKPSAGKILLDEKPLRSQLPTWHSEIGYVPQQVFIADDTIEHNIAFGIAACDIDRQALDAAIEMAQLRAFISTLPSGLQTIAGEDGCRLSGGQRQRIGLARALYRKPAVLILDEATSALDERTESSFTKTVSELPSRISVVSIAHRKKSLQFCEKYIELDQETSQLVGFSYEDPAGY